MGDAEMGKELAEISARYAVIEAELERIKKDIDDHRRETA